MGQRLNLEIRYGKEVLANAYYHWSAYTNSTLELANTIVEEIINKNIKFNRLLWNERIMEAVKVLELTGAGINKEEKEEIKSMRFLNVEEFKNCVDRNEGLISVSKKGISNNQYWAEHTCIIDVKDMSLDISDMFYIQTKEEFKEEKENYNEEYCFDDMTIIDYPTLKDIDFKEFKAIKSIMNKQKENREWYLLWNSKNGQKLLTLIE